MKIRTAGIILCVLPALLSCRNASREHKARNGAAPPAAVRIIEGLQGPESVLYDPEQDVYFISNIKGGELAADGDGFISRVQPDTLSLELKWIQGGENGVHLDGPKGMALLGDWLYVSDVTAVRKFDRHTGAPLAEIPLPGATFINDMATDGHSLYVSDTGLAMGPGETFRPTGTDAIWKITDDRATKIASGPALGHPNGLDVVDGKLWVVTFGGTELYELDGGKKTHVTNLPAGELDGLLHLEDGSRLVASWLGAAVYRGRVDGTFQAVLSGVPAPADIGYDTKRHRLLVPLSTSNQVTVNDLR